MVTEESKQIFCWGEIMREEKVCVGGYVSRAGDPVHAGDKTLTRETPTQRGRVNRYDNTMVKRKRTKRQTMVYKTLHRKDGETQTPLKSRIEQHEHHLIWKSCCTPVSIEYIQMT